MERRRRSQAGKPYPNERADTGSPPATNAPDCYKAARPRGVDHFLEVHPSPAARRQKLDRQQPTTLNCQAEQVPPRTRRKRLIPTDQPSAASALAPSTAGLPRHISAANLQAPRSKHGARASRVHANASQSLATPSSLGLRIPAPSAKFPIPQRPGG